MSTYYVSFLPCSEELWYRLILSHIQASVLWVVDLDRSRFSRPPQQRLMSQSLQRSCTTFWLNCKPRWILKTDSKSSEFHIFWEWAQNSSTPIFLKLSSGPQPVGWQFTPHLHTYLSVAIKKISSFSKTLISSRLSFESTESTSEPFV